MSNTSAPEVTELAELLTKAGFDVLLNGSEAWARLNITMPQLKVLMLLARHGSAPVSWLAGRMQVSPPNVTGILDRLEKEGWVRRTNDPHDRRVVRVILTPEGEVFLQDLRHAGQEALVTRLIEMTAKERDALSRGLTAYLGPAAAPTTAGAAD